MKAPKYDKDTPGAWAVFDLNAKKLDADGEVMPRSHEAFPGHLYKLTYNTPTWMPEVHARVFLKDPSFRVEDADGNVIPGLTRLAQERTAPEALPSNMVIADVNELTNEALLTRAAQRAGGGSMNGGTRREVLLRFLIEGFQDDMRPALSRANLDPDAGMDGGDPGEAESMDDDATAKMFSAAA